MIPIPRAGLPQASSAKFQVPEQVELVQLPTLVNEGSFVVPLAVVSVSKSPA